MYTVTSWDGCSEGYQSVAWFDKLKEARKYRLQLWREMKKKSKDSRVWLDPGLRPDRWPVKQALLLIEDTYNHNKIEAFVQEWNPSARSFTVRPCQYKDNKVKFHVIWHGKTTRSDGIHFRLVCRD